MGDAVAVADATQLVAKNCTVGLKGCGEGVSGHERM